jgi:hypothetical protein
MPYLSPQLMDVIKRIESGGNPNAQTGSYKGLYQLSDDEFRRYGGRGSIFDPNENARVAAIKLAAEAQQVEQRLGRPLTGAETYMVHQQGAGGAYEHISNPNRPAWQSMLATGEGQSKGEGWARKAIWGNVPDDVKARYGSVDNMTSGQFMDMWRNKMGSGASSVSSPFPTIDPNNPNAVIPGQINTSAPTTTAMPYINPSMAAGPQGVTLASNPITPDWSGTTGLAGGTNMVTPQGVAPIVPGPVPTPDTAAAPKSFLDNLIHPDTSKDSPYTKAMEGLDDAAKGLHPKIQAPGDAATITGPAPVANQPSALAYQLMAQLMNRNRGLTLTGQS